MRQRWYQVVPVVAVLAFAFVLALVRLDDLDIWWHLKCGEWFLHNGIPRREIFSYTANGAPWVDGYLLSQTLFYIALKIGGIGGVCVLGAILLTGIFALAFYLGWKDGDERNVGIWAALIISLPAIYVSRLDIYAKPALFTPLFALITLSLLESHFRRGGWRIAWLVPLTALWANCHPAFFIGPIMTLIYLAGCMVPMPGCPSREIRNRLALIFVAQLAATLLNPYGPGIYYSANVLAHNIEMRKILAEWRPMLGKMGESPGNIAAFLSVVAVVSAAFIWNIRRARPERLMLFIFVTIITLFAKRNLLLFGAICLPLIAWTVSETGDRRQATGNRQKRLTPPITHLVSGIVVVMSLFLIWFFATDRYYFYARMRRSTGLGIQTNLFPEEAVKLLKDEPVKGNIFHPYELGGYLMFKLYPKYRVFIDGRIYPYSFELFQTQTVAFKDFDTFERLRTTYDIRAAILPLFPRYYAPLAMQLLLSPDWAAVHVESAGILFLRRNAGNDDIIRKYEMNLMQNPPPIQTRPPGRKFHLWNKAEFPFGVIGWSNLYTQIGRYDLALQTIKIGLDYRPVYKPLLDQYNELKNVYGGQ